jgi:GNAT superfamily N-acetyltransferase
MKVSSFQGDYDELSNLVQRSWAENNDSHLRYTAGFLQNAFTYPNSSFDLAPCVYEHGRLVAFIAGFPRNVVWNGKRERLILSTLLTSSPDTRGKGYGAWLWLELIRRTQSSGYDGMISISVEGGAVNRIVAEGSRLLRVSSARIYEVRYQSLLLNGIYGDNSTEGDVGLFLQLAAKTAGDCPLRRVWGRPEAEWQCRNRSGALSVQLEGGCGRGMITGYVADVAGPVELRALNIEDVLWDELDVTARMQLLRSFLAAGVARGAKVASIGMTNSTDYNPLKQGRFRSIRRQMNIYVTRWDRAPEPVDSMYLDVF